MSDTEDNSDASTNQSAETGKKLDPRPFFLIGILVVLAVGGFFILGGGHTQHNYYKFAACLADHNMTMYGFDACPHCNKQKNLIGRDAFHKEIDQQGLYVRCRPNSESTKTLKEAGIDVNRISSVTPLKPTDTQGDACQINVGAGTPTWVVDGEKKPAGEQSLKELSQYSGCSLPDNYHASGDVGGFTNRSKVMNQ